MTTSDLAVSEQRAIAVRTFGEEKLGLLKEQIGRGWKREMTDAELAVVAEICNRTRLDPLAKPPQIYFIPRRDSNLKRDVMTPQVSIDGLRLMASRSRHYAGQVGPHWCGPDGVWKDMWLADEHPAAARVGTLRRGSREPIWGVATWKEWAQYETVWEGPEGSRRPGGKKLASFWETKGAHMLAKTAEAISLKRALPHETNDLEIARITEVERLEAPALAAQYAKIYGDDVDSEFAALPYGAGAPKYDALPAASEVQPEEVSATDSAAEERQDSDGPDRGVLLEQYGGLLRTAATSGAVAPEDLHDWLLPAGTPEEQIIAKGRELRALVKQHNQAPAAAPSAPMPETAAIPPREQNSITARSALANRLAVAVEQAALLDVPFDDCRVSFPAPEEEVIRKCEALEARVQDAKDASAAATSSSGQQSQAEYELETVPF